MSFLGHLSWCMITTNSTEAYYRDIVSASSRRKVSADITANRLFITPMLHACMC